MVPRDLAPEAAPPADLAESVDVAFGERADARLEAAQVAELEPTLGERAIAPVIGLVHRHDRAEEPARALLGLEGELLPGGQPAETAQELGVPTRHPADVGPLRRDPEGAVPRQPRAGEPQLAAHARQRALRGGP